MEPAKKADFFLGANSPIGFTSYYAELNDPSRTKHCYVIKGCPGSGKSTMMKQIAAEMEKGEGLIETIHCSSDPDSLDAVILHDKSAIIADGTLPHAIEPQLPVAYEQVISLFACFDSQKMTGLREDAIETDKKIKACHRRCCNYLAGAAMLLEDNRRIALECTDIGKIQKLAQKLALKEFKKKGGAGLERKRLLSAVTPKGILTFGGTVTALCEKVYLIKDAYGASAGILLQALKAAALAHGYEVFGCYCPLDQQNKLEHLLIPELSLGFVTENSFTELAAEPYRVIHFSRFTDKAKLKLKKQRLSFNRRAAKEILSEAVKTLETAKAHHDTLEDLYRQGLDFAQITQIQVQTLEKFRALL